MFLKSIPLFVLFFAFSNAFAQNWQSHYSQNDIEISTREEMCEKKAEGIKKNYLFLKVENTGSQALSIDYQIQKWYDGKCINCEASNQENGTYSIELKANETAVGSCENYRNRSLAVFSSMPNHENVRKLTQVKIIPISINGKNL